MSRSEQGPVGRTRLAEIRMRIARASPGTWVLTETSEGLAIATGRPDGRLLRIKRDQAMASNEDVVFIALAHAVLPRLVDALEAPEQRLFADGELDAVDAAVGGASGGPWTAFVEEVQPIGGCSMIWAGDEPDAPDMYVWLGDEIAPAGDIDFIAAARQDVPDLVSELRFRRRPRV